MLTSPSGSSNAPNLLRQSRDGSVVTITFDNPPVNALSVTVMGQLREALNRLGDDDTAKVIVFESAIPDFFIAHVDMRLAEQMDELRLLADAAPHGVNVFQAIGEQIRRQPQVTIIKLAGIARGGGAELVAAADMTFAARNSAKLGQIEALMGIVPSGGGTQYLLERVGRNRALELVLTGDAIDADTAAAYGWVNRVVADGDLDDFVARIAHSIGDLPDGVISAAKTILAPADLTEGYQSEEREWAALIEQPAAVRLMSTSMQRGAQTVDGERNLESLLREINSE